jgi:acetyl-CoA carboxylase carboxyltransferase component
MARDEPIALAAPLTGELIALAAPLTGEVIELRVAPGQAVLPDATLCVLEAMKMEHPVPAPVAGVVREICVAVGDVVEQDATILFLAPQPGARVAVAREGERDPGEVRPDLAEVVARHALLLDAARPEAVARRRERGQRTARENVEDLCDPGSFVEYGALAVAAQRRARPLDELRSKTAADGILTGLGTVNAGIFGPDSARCAILAADATVLAGTQGFFHHRKIDRILDLAAHHELPVVFFAEGGGGRPNDTDTSDVVAAGLNVTSFGAWSRLSGSVPRVGIVSGFCFAGSAAFAGCSDVVIATRNANLGMGGPAMIEGGGLGSFSPREIGPVSVQEPNGVLDLVVEDERAAVAATRRYLSYFQGRLPTWECADQRQLRHAVPESRRQAYDVRRVIELLCDTGSVLELRPAYGVGILTALVRIEGRPLGLIANNPLHLGGAIDPDAAEKAARFLQLCDAFGLPLVSLCDTPGFMVGPEVEARAQVRKVSRLFVAGANLSVPLFAVLLRKGYGLGAQSMAGGSFLAPFFTVAWPTGEIGGMGLEGAVNLGFRKQLDAIADPRERDALFEKLVGRMFERGKALEAASLLELDAVIDPMQTRAWLLRGLGAAGPLRRAGRRNFVDTW